MKMKFVAMTGIGLLVIGAVWAAPEWSDPTSVLEVKDNTGHVVATVTLVRGSKIYGNPGEWLDAAGNYFQTIGGMANDVRIVSADGSDLFTLKCGTNSDIWYDKYAVKKITP